MGIFHDSVFFFGVYIEKRQGCGQKVGLVMQPYQGSADTPWDSYFQVMF